MHIYKCLHIPCQHLFGLMIVESSIDLPTRQLALPKPHWFYFSVFFIFLVVFSSVQVSWITFNDTSGSNQMLADCFALGKIILWRKTKGRLQPIDLPIGSSGSIQRHWRIQRAVWVIHDHKRDFGFPLTLTNVWFLHAKAASSSTVFPDGELKLVSLEENEWMGTEWTWVFQGGRVVLFCFLNDEIECITLRLWFYLYDSFNATSLFSDCSYSRSCREAKRGAL